MGYNMPIWDVEYTDEFERWWNTLDEEVQDSIDRIVHVLQAAGPALSRPLVDTLKGSRHAHMKELRVQRHGEPYRVLFAFDPRRTAILLIGGNKGADKRWYDRMIPLADDLYDRHLRDLRKDGLIE